MRTLSALLTFLLLLVLAAVASAQTTTPYTTADRVLWDGPEGVASVADAQAAVYNAYAAGAGVQNVKAPLVHTCGVPLAPDTRASCTAPIPAAILPALNARTSILTVTAGVTITGTDGNPTLVESVQSAPFVAGRPYGAPGRPRLSR